MGGLAVIPVARPLIGDEECAAVEAILRSGQLAQGTEVEAFEREYSQTLDGRRCIAVSSGTSALHLALLALGIGPGDEVIVPSFTFAATANAVALTGADPVFADIEDTFYCLDPLAVEAAVTRRTVAILPVHLFGHPADMAELARIAGRHGLGLLEDAAQAHQAAIGDRSVGTFGAAGMFSFYSTKNMTTGEGGLICTSDAAVERTARLLRNQGMERRYYNEIVGFNLRMTEIAAAIGRAQLRKLPGWTATRRANAAFLTRHLENVVVPREAPAATHVYHQYTVRVPGHDRDEFAERLAHRGIGSAVHYPTPVHRLPTYKRPDDLPVSERVARECLSLPVHPSLSPADLERIADAVNDLARAGR